MMQEWLEKLEADLSVPDFPLVITKLPYELRDNKEFMLAVMAYVNGNPIYNPILLQVSTRLTADKEVVRCAISQDPHNLSYMHWTLRDDDRFLLSLARMKATRDFCIYHYASHRLRMDVNFTLSMIERYKTLLIEDIPNELRRDRTIACAVLNVSPQGLQYLNAFQDDTDMVGAAVSDSHGAAFRFASERLKQDPEMISLALQSGPRGLGAIEAPTAAQVMEAVTWHGRALRYAASAFQTDERIVRIAVHQDPSALEFASDLFRSDKSLIKELVDRNRTTIQHALGVNSNCAPHFKYDPEWERPGPRYTRLLLLRCNLPPELCNLVAQLLENAHMKKEAERKWLCAHSTAYWMAAA
jgi:hypothetical protein